MFVPYWSRFLCLLALAGLVVFPWQPAEAQQSRRVGMPQFFDDEDEEEEQGEKPERPPRPSAPPDGSVEVDADRLEYDADRRIMIGIGNVMVRQHSDILRADYIEVHTETQVAVARGNVHFDRSGRTWQGDAFTYNFRTREGDFGEFLVFNDPYYVRARESQQVSTNVFRLRNARVTTCTPDDRQEFVIRARTATITDGSVLRARHVVTTLYGVPLFYTPYLKKDFSKRSNIDIMPGYSSRMGAFLLTAYSFYPTPHVRATTHLDYRSKRGIGVGQGLRWRIPQNNAQGRMMAYYINDDWPFRSESQRLIREDLVDSDRYWLGFRHTQSLAPRQMLRTEVNYVSDPFMLEDFFDSDFRRGVQPENRATLTHRGDNYTASLLLNMRLNDFYDNVNRMPEATLDVNRQQIGVTPLYYESEHSAAYLERVFPKQSDLEDYDAFRVDSSHTVLYPMRYFGFLSVIPSVGYRGTWYSATREESTTTNFVAQVDEDGEFVLDEDGNAVFGDEEVTTVRDGSAAYRNIYRFRVETSFKAFRVLHEEPNYLGEGLRHVAEPYARYTLVPEPNVLPDELHQFDEVDRLNERHDVRLGIRNKLQTRRGERRRIHDFIDLNTYTILRIDPDGDENTFDHFFFETRLRLTEWMRIDFDGAYDWYENDVEQFNTQVAFIARDRSTLGLEYRYSRDRRQTVQAEVVLFPRATWSGSGYWRFDVDEGDLEEHSYLIQRRFDCTMFGVGVRGRLQEDGDTEWRAWAQVSLLAFPDSELRLGR